MSSVVRWTDSNGTLVSTYQYDPYGNLLSSTGSVANPWRFAGGYFDSSTGLYKYGTRYYDAAIGRWSQQDPVRGQLNDPTSLNRYVYAGDDPVNFTDPSGRDECGLAELRLFRSPTGYNFKLTLVTVSPITRVDIVLSWYQASVPLMGVETFYDIFAAPAGDSWPPHRSYAKPSYCY